MGLEGGRGSCDGLVTGGCSSCVVGEWVCSYTGSCLHTCTVMWRWCCSCVHHSPKLAAVRGLLQKLWCCTQRRDPAAALHGLMCLRCTLVTASLCGIVCNTHQGRLLWEMPRTLAMVSYRSPHRGPEVQVRVTQQHTEQGQLLYTRMMGLDWSSRSSAFCCADKTTGATTHTPPGTEGRVGRMHRSTTPHQRTASRPAAARGHT